MSRNLTADETRSQYTALMGQELGSLFYALYNELGWLHLRWRQYRELFGTKPERVELLNQSARLFFLVVQESLWEDTLLRLSRITDKPETFGKTNLTVQRLPALLSDQALAAELCGLVDDAVAKTAFARDWRNRHIAHTDLALALKQGATPLAPASRHSVSQAIEALDDVLNRLELHFRNGRILFGALGHPGDAESLLYVIRDGLEAEEAQRLRVRQGRPSEEDLRPPSPL